MTTVRPISGLVLVAPAELVPSPANPRDELTGISELAQSIRELGMIQPIIAQRLVDGRLQVVAGHRRRAAAISLQLPQVPVVIRRDMLPDEELLSMLVENGQRAGLDPIEEARAMRKLGRAGISHQEIARKVGRTQPWVSARLSLLALPIEEQEALRRGEITITAAAQLGRIESGTVRPKAKGKALNAAAAAMENGDVTHEDLRVAGVDATARLGWCERATFDAHDAAGPWIDWLRKRAREVESR